MQSRLLLCKRKIAAIRHFPEAVAEMRTRGAARSDFAPDDLRARDHATHLLGAARLCGLVLG
jgi:hypothetical protein